MNEDKNFFRASAEDFKKIPSVPVAYWVSDKLIRAFEEGKQLSRYALPRQGIATGDNGRFLRLWHEVSNSKIEFCGRQGRQTTKKWYPCRKGGPYRRWYGNFDIVVNWENDGAEIRQFMGPNGRLASRPQNVQYNFLEGMSWSSIGHSFAMRYAPPGSLFETKGSTCLTKQVFFL